MRLCPARHRGPFSAGAHYPPRFAGAHAALAPDAGAGIFGGRADVGQKAGFG